LSENLKQRYVIARNPWAARKILNQIRDGKREAAQVLFTSVGKANQRIRRMSIEDQPKFHIYGTDLK